MSEWARSKQAELYLQKRREGIKKREGLAASLGDHFGTEWELRNLATRNLLKKTFFNARTHARTHAHTHTRTHAHTHTHTQWWPNLSCRDRKHICSSFRISVFSLLLPPSSCLLFHYLCFSSFFPREEVSIISLLHLKREREREKTKSISLLLEQSKHNPKQQDTHVCMWV